MKLTPEDFQAQVDVAAGQVQNADANLEQQTQNLQRQTELFRTRVNALQDFQNATFEEKAIFRIERPSCNSSSRRSIEPRFSRLRSNSAIFYAASGVSFIWKSHHES